MFFDVHHGDLVELLSLTSSKGGCGCVQPALLTTTSSLPGGPALPAPWSDLVRLRHVGGEMNDSRCRNDDVCHDLLAQG